MAERLPSPGLPLSLALVSDLRDLAVDLAVGGYTRTNLAMLERDLQRSVPAALGATVALIPNPVGAVVRFNLVPRSLQPEELRDALRVSLPSSDASFEASITFYAGCADAFADLAEDLDDVLALSIERHPGLPTSPIEPGTAGLTDFSSVNIALGHLLNRGRTLTQARAELVRYAEHNDTDLAGAARLLLGSHSY